MNRQSRRILNRWDHRASSVFSPGCETWALLLHGPAPGVKFSSPFIRGETHGALHGRARPPLPKMPESANEASGDSSDGQKLPSASGSPDVGAIRSIIFPSISPSIRFCPTGHLFQGKRTAERSVIGQEGTPKERRGKIMRNHEIQVTIGHPCPITPQQADTGVLSHRTNGHPLRSSIEELPLREVLRYFRRTDTHTIFNTHEDEDEEKTSLRGKKEPEEIRLADSPMPQMSVGHSRLGRRVVDNMILMRRSFYFFQRQCFSIVSKMGYFLQARFGSKLDDYLISSHLAPLLCLNLAICTPNVAFYWHGYPISILDEGGNYG